MRTKSFLFIYKNRVFEFEGARNTNTNNAARTHSYLDSLVFASPKLLYKMWYRGMSAACRLMVWQSHHTLYIRVARAAVPFDDAPNTKNMVERSCTEYFDSIEWKHTTQERNVYRPENLKWLKKARKAKKQKPKKKNEEKWSKSRAKIHIF